MLYGVDWHAEQAKACAGSRPRGDQQLQRARDLNRRAGHNVRKASRACRWAEGMFSFYMYSAHVVNSLQVGLLVHLDPPVAHTINIEPLTPEDWESKF